MSPSPFARLIALLGRAVPVPGWFVLVLDPLLLVALRCGRGPRRVRVRRHGVRLELDLADYVQRKLFCHSHQEGELRFVAAWCRPGDAVFDIGANVGAFSLVAARATGPDGVVHALEPVPATRTSLRRNVELNGFAHVHIHGVAASDERGELALGLVSETYGSGGYTRGGNLHTVTVPAVPLSELVEHELADRRIRLVKIDVEGDECRAVSGLAPTLSADRRPDAMLIEFSEPALYAHGASGATLADQLRGSGYELFRRRGSELRPYTPLEPGRAARGVALLASGCAGPVTRARRLYWGYRLLADVIAVRAELGRAAVQATLDQPFPLD